MLDFTGVLTHRLQEENPESQDLLNILTTAGDTGLQMTEPVPTTTSTAGE